MARSRQGTKAFYHPLVGWDLKLSREGTSLVHLPVLVARGDRLDDIDKDPIRVGCYKMPLAKFLIPKLKTDGQARFQQPLI
ncbi:hypothetical protein ACVJBD_001358 [Rhizobium mongolense]